MCGSFTNIIRYHLSYKKWYKWIYWVGQKVYSITSYRKESESESLSVMSDFLWPHGLYSPWNSPGQNTGVGSLSLLQEIFPNQGSNPGLPHWWRILYQLCHQGSPRTLEWAACPFSSGSFQPGNQTGVSCIAGRFLTSWAIREAPASYKKTQINFWPIQYTQNRNRLTVVENELLPKGKGGGGGSDSEYGANWYKLLYISNKDDLQNRRKCLYLVIIRYHFTPAAMAMTGKT